MCTLTLAWRVLADAPVAVAANRDEALGRESLPPGVYREVPRVVAPQDAEAGGTWIGYNERGVFAGITNGWSDADLAGERSRGLLVGDVLEAGSAAAADDVVEAATETHEYEGFNLVVADESTATLYRWDGALSRTSFEPGVHVVVNAAADDETWIPESRPDLARAQAANAREVRRELAVEGDEAATSWLERAGDVLGDHEYGVCVHRDGFGTRSSSLIALAADGTATYEFAPGPPCETAFEPVDAARGTTPEGPRSDAERHI